jgi:chromate transporter
LAGLIYFGIKNRVRSGEGDIKNLLLLALPSAGAGAAGVTSMKLFWVFLKIGAVLFGSGYVLIAYLDGELVQQLGWLTEQELLDAVAIGQFTPGPVLSTASFIGYQINGWSGALAATAGIFLPSFLFVFLLNPLVPRMRRSTLLRGFLDAVNVGAVAIMAVVCIQLGMGIVVDWISALIAISAIFVVFRFKKVSSIWIIVGGAVMGYLLHML